MTTKKSNGLRPVYISLTTILVFAILTIGIVSYFYASHFSGGLSSKQGTWGEFGDFFGGTLNPILSFLTIIALLLTIVLQVDELKQARAAAEASASALTSQLKIAENQAREQSFFRFLDELKSDEEIKSCIKESRRLAGMIYAFIYKDGIENTERKVITKEIEPYINKIFFMGSLFQHAIEKTTAISKIINEFDEDDRAKYSKLTATYLTMPLVSVIYHVSSMCYEKHFDHIKKTKMIFSAREDLIFTKKVSLTTTELMQEKFNKNRSTLIDSFEIRMGELIVKARTIIEDLSIKEEK